MINLRAFLPWVCSLCEDHYTIGFWRIREEEGMVRADDRGDMGKGAGYS